MSLSLELRLAQQIKKAFVALGKRYTSPFAGDTYPDQRKAAQRAQIHMHNLADKPCGKTTFAGAFEMTYREPL